MVQINFATREVNCKIVFYGPGRCGKTTNLQVVHAKAPPNSTGDLVSIATETDRTLYFDFLPLDLGQVAGMRTKFSLYTVPGQVYYDATRKLVLQGADGIVFVADSNPDMMEENIESLNNLAVNLRENGLDINELPVVLQFNKRDLENPVPIEEMNAKLNRANWPAVPAVAVNGDGVFQTLKAISQFVIKKLNREQGYSEDGSRRGGGAARPSAKSAAAPPPPSPKAPTPQPQPAAKPATPTPASAASLPKPKFPTPAPQPVVLPKKDPPSGAVLPKPQAPAAAPAPEVANAPEAAVEAPATPAPASAPALNPVAAEIAKRKRAEEEARRNAPAEEPVEAAVPAAPAGGGGSKTVVIVLAVLALAGVAAALFFVFKGSGS